MLSVFGGKLTTYRHLAQSAIDLLASRIPELAGPGWTDSVALPGGDFPMDGAAKLVEELIAHYPFLQRGWAEWLIASYGRRAWLVLAARRVCRIAAFTLAMA